MAKSPPIANGKYQVFPTFTGTDAACTGAAFLLPPDFTYGQALPPVALRFVYAGGADWQSPQYRVSNADFAFAFIPDPPLNRAPQPPWQSSVAAQVTVLGNNAWKCAPAARRALMASWTAFWQQVETTLEVAGLLTPGATRLLAWQVAEVVPAPLEETLFYHFGLQPGFADATFPYVDVQPGMQLRVEFEASQFLSPGGPTNGYVGAAQFRWAVQSAPAPGGGRMTTFDAFLSSISAASVAFPAAPVIAGGLPDLHAAGMARRYVRLCHPQSLPAGTDPGDLGLAGNVALLGADTLADLEAATAAYADGTCAPGTSPRGVTCTVFRGRAVVVPEIAVWLQMGSRDTLQMEYVPLGTTVGQVLERVSTWRPLGHEPSLGTPVRLSRLVSSSATGQQFLDVYLWPSSTPGTVLDPRGLDLPLVKGDRVVIELPG